MTRGSTGRPAGTRAVVVHPDADTLVAATAARLALAVLDAQSLRREVHVALTGGRVGTRVAEAFLASDLLGALDLTGLHLWWGDERFAADGSADRNDTPVAGALAGLAERGARLHPVAGPDRAADVEAAARAYADELDAAGITGGADSTAALDVVLLGVGPDGHVASLFPGHAALEAGGSAVAVHDSPKPPPQRVSLTRDVIDGARQVWLLGSGAEKAEAVTRGLAGDAESPVLPCALVSGTDRTLWLLDLEAAGGA